MSRRQQQQQQQLRLLPVLVLVGLFVLAITSCLSWTIGYRVGLVQQELLQPSAVEQRRTTTTSSSISNNKKADNINDDYMLAYKQSYGFFDDISSREWKLMQQRHRNIQLTSNNMCSYCRGRPTSPNAYFQNHFEPEFSCRHTRRIGRLGDGGKWTCDPHRIAAKVMTTTGSSISSTTKERRTTSTNKKDKYKDDNNGCLIYSVGSNNDFSFEEHVHKDIHPNCEIHTFDPSNYSETATKYGVHYHQWGIGSGSDTKDPEARRKGWTMKTFNETVHELGHVGRVIDIFKIDCEGCELTSFQSWFGSDSITPPPAMLRQVLVEVHASKDAIKPNTTEFFQGMHDNGYVIFHKEPNIHYWHFGPAIEYAFLKLHPDFFSLSN